MRQRLLHQLFAAAALTLCVLAAVDAQSSSSTGSTTGGGSVSSSSTSTSTGGGGGGAVSSSSTAASGGGTHSSSTAAAGPGGDSSSGGSSSGGGSTGTTPLAGTPTGTTLCDRLTTAIGQKLTAVGSSTALSAFVTKAFTGWPGQPGLYSSTIVGGYFNGGLQYRYPGDPSSIITSQPLSPTSLVSPDFGSSASSSTTQLRALVTSLTLFFGQSTVFGCTASPGTYMGSDNMYGVHQRMNITQAVFTAFNDILVATATAYGLNAADATAFQAGLSAFGRNNFALTTEICEDPTCTCAPTVNGANCENSLVPVNSAVAVVSSMASLMVAGVVAFLAPTLYCPAQIR